MHVTFKEAGQETGHQATAIFGKKAAFVQFDVVAILQHGNNGGIGRWTANAQLFQIFHKACFGKTWGRLSEVLLGTDVLQAEGLAFGHFGENTVILFAGTGAVIVAAFVIDAVKTVKGNHRAGGAHDDGSFGLGNIHGDLV